MTKAKTTAKKHATAYIATVFADRLREAGFVCPNSDLLCWYRKRSNEIVNSIIFCSSWSDLPLFLEINYGIFPTFAQPIRLNGVVNNHTYDEELFTHRPIVENHPGGGCRMAYSEDIEVFAPREDGRGLYSLEKLLLPHMDRIQSIEEAYAFHKERRLNCNSSDKRPEYRLGVLSRSFIDMALWVDDTEMYDLALYWADDRAYLYESLAVHNPKRQQYAQERKAWDRLFEVLETNDRDRYIAELKGRMEQNAKVLQQKYLKGVCGCNQ